MDFFSAPKANTIATVPVTPAPRFPRVWVWPSGVICAETDENVVVVAGDAAFTCGISYEALNNASRKRNGSSSCLTTTNGRSRKTLARLPRYLNNIVDQSDLRPSARQGAPFRRDDRRQDRGAFRAQS